MGDAAISVLIECCPEFVGHFDPAVALGLTPISIFQLYGYFIFFRAYHATYRRADCDVHVFEEAVRAFSATCPRFKRLRRATTDQEFRLSLEGSSGVTPFRVDFLINSLNSWIK